MIKLLIISDDLKQAARLSAELAERGLNCSVSTDIKITPDKAAEQGLDITLVNINGSPDSSGSSYLDKKTGRHRNPPVIALLSAETLESLDPATPIDDFVLTPWDANEVALRVKRILRRTKGIGRGESIKCGDLVIDLDNREVTVGGRLVTLTFREYELLKFLASNRGRAFTREGLLNEVWGYDYFGGDRTVDVHIRRLRSKIEDSTHTFIETVRNIGYRFKKHP